MPNPGPEPGPRRAAFILTIWADAMASPAQAWRGYLECGAGRRQYFRTLADLNRLLVEGGWVDPPQNQPVES
jgi:hypothetical protein